MRRADENVTGPAEGPDRAAARLATSGVLLSEAVAQPQVLHVLSVAISGLVSPGRCAILLEPIDGGELARYAHSLPPNGRVVGVDDLPQRVSSQLGGFDHAFVCPLPCVRQGRRSMLRLLVVATEQPLPDTAHPALSQLATQSAAAICRLAMDAELTRLDGDQCFRALVANAEEIILVVDPDDLRIRYATPSAAALFGGADVTGRDLLTLVHAAEHGEVNGLLTSLLEAKAPHQVAGSDAGPPVPATEPAVSDWRVGLDGDGTRVAVSVQDLREDASIAGLVVRLRDVTDQRRWESELARRAVHDPLTGLPNRVAFEQRLDRAARGAAGVVAVLCLDIDNFKIINDTLGHQTGDRLLQVVAERLTASLPPGALAVRLGGDEFAVLVEHADSAEQVDDLAKELTAALAEPFSLRGDVMSPKASIGVASTTDPAFVPDLLRQADLALYVAKREGKGRWQRHDPAVWTDIADRLQLRAALEQAVPNNELVLEYQPIVDLSDRSTVGLEALLRWDHPTRGRLAPDAFIDIAEESGAIITIGEWAVREALTTAMRWRGRVGPRAPYVSVNISARQFLEPGFANHVQQALDQSGLPPDRLMLELTESLLLHDGAQVWTDLAGLRRRGTRLAVDDFGTGYSALSYLRQMPMDVLKLDRMFVHDVVDNERDAELLRGIIQLAHSLGLAVVAEGIETERQCTLLRGLGCEYGQGFLMSRPMPESAVLDWIRASPCA